MDGLTVGEKVITLNQWGVRWRVGTISRVSPMSYWVEQLVSYTLTRSETKRFDKRLVRRFDQDLLSRLSAMDEELKVTDARRYEIVFRRLAAWEDESVVAKQT